MPPIGQSTKMHNKENTTFLALLRLFFCTEIDSKNDLMHILKRLVRGGGLICPKYC